MKIQISVAGAALIATSSFVNAENMKAIVVHEYGGAEAMKLEDLPRPEPKANQMLIKVIAAGVNPVDAMIRSGMFSKSNKLEDPLIPGGDIAGIVEKAGTGITKFKNGDRVYDYVSLKDNGG